MTANAAHKHLFYSEMAKLLEAGFDIRKAAAVLLDTQLPPQQVALLAALNQGLEAGESIVEAFGTALTDIERSIIGAGERSGKLATAFQHLADYFGMLATAHREWLKGMIYPLIVLHIGVFIGIVPTALMEGEMGAAEILGNLLLTLLVIYIAVFSIWMGIRGWLKSAPKNANIDRWLNRFPWIGKARRNLAMARFCKVYHSCVLAGISMSETAQLAAEASQSGVIREAGLKLVQVAKAGNALGPQFMADDAFPKAFSRSYSTGEEAGTLDKDLARWSKLYQDEAESSAKVVSVMVPKLLYFIILAFAGWKILGFYGDYYSVLEQISE